MRTTASSTIASTAALRPKNSAAIDRHVAVAGIDVAERHDGDDAGQDEQPAGHDAAERAVHQPADIGRELLRLGPGQQHAVVERVQKPALPRSSASPRPGCGASPRSGRRGRRSSAPRRAARPGTPRAATRRVAARIDRLPRSRAQPRRASFTLAAGQLWVSAWRLRHQA